LRYLPSRASFGVEKTGMSDRNLCGGHSKLREPALELLFD